MRTRKLGLAALVAVLALSIAAAPASAVSKREKKQNKSLRALNKRTKATNKRLKRLGSDLGKLTADVKNAKDGLSAIQAAVPTVVSTLTTLGDAAKQLKAGLEQAGAGLTQLKGGLTGLKDAFTGYVGAAEYGVVQLYLGTTPVPGQLLTSSDIPDDANQATVSGQLFAGVPNGASNVPVTLRAAVRSGESDGTGAADPVAVAGLQALSATAVGATVAGGNGGGAPTTVPLTSKPNAALGGVPAYPIANKAPRVDDPPNPFAFPNAQSIELTDPATLQTLTAAPTRFTVSNASGNPGIVQLDVTVRFNDLSASADDLTE